MLFEGRLGASVKPKDEATILVHAWRRHDLPERRRRLTGKSGARALDRTRSGVNPEAVEQVLEPCRVATGQHGEAFQAEQREHFINGGVAGRDAARSIIVNLQYGEVVGGGCNLRRRHWGARFGKLGAGAFAALRHRPRLYHVLTRLARFRGAFEPPRIGEREKRKAWPASRSRAERRHVDKRQTPVRTVWRGRAKSTHVLVKKGLRLAQDGRQAPVRRRTAIDRRGEVLATCLSARAPAVHDAGLRAIAATGGRLFPQNDAAKRLALDGFVPPKGVVAQWRVVTGF